MVNRTSARHKIEGAVLCVDLVSNLFDKPHVILDVGYNVALLPVEAERLGRSLIRLAATARSKGRR